MAAIATAASKTYQSALCAIPPLELWAAMDPFRIQYDKHYQRWWMPHVNVLYPFVPDEGDNFADAADRLGKQLKDVEPFEVTLGALDFFTHSAKSYTIWQTPECEEGAFDRLMESLLHAYPDHTEQCTIGDCFTPHLSLGQWQDKAVLRKDMKRLERAIPRQTFSLDALYLISRNDFHDPFHIRHAIPLGGRSLSAAAAALLETDGPPDYGIEVPKAEEKKKKPRRTNHSRVQ